MQKPDYWFRLTYCLRRYLTKTLLVMKLTLLLSIVSILNVSAHTAAQTVSFSGKDIPLKKVFAVIEKQTGYVVFTGKEVLAGTKPVSLSVHEMPLADFLSIALRDQPVSYKIADKTIILIRKPPAEKTPPVVMQPEEYVQPPLIDIRGKIVDRNGAAVAGASILIKGTQRGTTSDEKGNFLLKATDKNSVLIISYTGYKIQEIPLKGRTEINVQLELDVKSLDDVVIIGYGTQSRKNLTSSISSVKGEDIARVPVTNLDAALQGKVAGVQIVQNSGAPGDETYIRIRGNGSLFGENRPLYVIDGVPMNNIPAGAAPLSADGQRITATNDINPNDIQSIEVLKDAGATAIYGSRAANGVILITTKKGAPGKAKFSISAYSGLAKVTKRLPLLNNDQYVQLIREERVNAALSADPTITNTGINTNWQDSIFRQASVSEVNLSISGGANKMTHYLSFGYFDQAGTIVGRQHFKRFNGRANFEYMATEKLKIGFSLNGTHSINNRMDNNYSGYSVIANALVYNPNYPVKNADGTYYRDVNNRATNPVMIANTLRFLSVADRYVGNIFGEYDIIKGLKFKTSIGMDNQGIQDDRYESLLLHNNNSPASGSLDYFNQLLWLNENTLSYTPVLKNRHSLTFLVGQSAQVTSVRRMGAAGNTNSTDITQAITGFSNRTEASDYRSKSGLVSYFSRVNYSYASVYLLQFAMRVDGSSRFGDNKKYGYFPTISGAWRVSNEAFMKKQKLINELKLRGSIGVAGSQEGLGSDFPSLATYATGANYGQEAGIATSALSNKDLSWEATTQTNVGLDLTFLDNRINITVDAYRKVTNRLIFKLLLPYSSGFTSTNGANIGQMTNKGLDCNLSTENIRGKFSWSTNFNISFNRNKITSLPETIHGDPTSSDFIESLPGNFGTVAPSSIFRVGESVGSFFGYRSKGVDPASGNILYEDINKDGKITAADRVIIGNALPKFTGGLSNTFSYKGFDLNIVFFWSSGNRVYNQTRAVLERMSGYNNGDINTLSRWIPSTVNTAVPRAFFNDPVPANGQPNGVMSQRWLEDGSFIRLKNVALNYNLPMKWLKKINLSSVKVYISGSNLAIWTKYSGYDPESQNQQFKNSQLGVDYATQPQPRSFTAGINVNF